MKKIEIDLDVHRFIENNRLDFNESENTILRRLLKIDQDENLVANFMINRNLDSYLHLMSDNDSDSAYHSSLLESSGPLDNKADEQERGIYERMIEIMRENAFKPQLQKKSSLRAWLPYWYYKGASLPDGTKLQHYTKKERIEAEIKNGSISLNGKYFKSPSAAAMEVNGGVNVNGWHFWEFLDPTDGRWKKLITLRPSDSERGPNNSGASPSSDL